MVDTSHDNIEMLKYTSSQRGKGGEVMSYNLWNQNKLAWIHGITGVTAKVGAMLTNAGEWTAEESA